MFALLAPAGFAIVIGVRNSVDGWRKAKQREEASRAFRGAAAGALPDADLEEWRQRAELATQRIAGLEMLLEARRHLKAAGMRQSGSRGRCGDAPARARDRRR